MVVKYPYGTRAKERFQLRGQLFERKEVHILRFVPGIEDESRICSVSAQDLWETEISEASQNRNCHLAGILPTAAGVPPLA